MKPSFVGVFLLALSQAQAQAQAAPLASDVGDADSFGRNVIYLGVAGTPTVFFKSNCTVSPPAAPARCVTMAAQPALTNYAENKLASLTIPGKSTHSLLCFAVTPSLNFQFHNLTGVAQPTARFGARPTVSLENSLLNDPSLIDPTTGSPFNGRITASLLTYMESRSMAVNERDLKQFFMSRHCIEGLVSKRSLQDVYGLPATVVDNFFDQPITLTFGVAGETQLVSNGSYFFGIRIYGDAP